MAQVSQIVKMFGIPIYRNTYISNATPSLQLFDLTNDSLNDKPYEDTQIGFKKHGEEINEL